MQCLAINLTDTAHCFIVAIFSLGMQSLFPSLVPFFKLYNLVRARLFQCYQLYVQQCFFKCLNQRNPIEPNQSWYSVYQINQECNNCGLLKIVRLVIKLLKLATLLWTLKASSLIILLKVDNHRKKWPHFAQWWVSLLFALKGLKSDKVASFSNC